MKVAVGVRGFMYSGGMRVACWGLKAGAKLQARLTISSNSH